MAETAYNAGSGSSRVSSPDDVLRFLFGDVSHLWRDDGESDAAPRPRLVYSGDGFNTLSPVSDGGGLYPSSYELTERGVLKVLAWLHEHGVSLSVPEGDDERKEGQ